MDFKNIITKSINTLLKDMDHELVYTLEHPTDKNHGDYASNIALVLFPLIKRMQDLPLQKKLSDYRSPRDLAELLQQELIKDSSIMKILERVEVAGAGFINFFIKSESLINELEHITAKGDQYGSNESGKGKTWLIEHTSPNPNKAMHLGHLRNNVTGMAIGNIAKFQGYKVIFDCIDNNRGIAIAKLMWGYLKFARKDKTYNTDINYWHSHQNEWLTPQEAQKRPDRFMDELYIMASEDFVNPDVEQVVRQLVIDWEIEKPLVWDLWERVLDFVYKGQKMTLDRLDSHWDHIWHEHEHYKEGKKIVLTGIDKGVFKIGNNGAVVTNLSAFNLPDTVVIKADGTALYITQDLALTKLKFSTFNPDKAFWVIGPEQSLAMKQVFAVCEQLGIAKIKNCNHLAYGYMSIKGQGKMSSRSGNVVYIDDLIDLSKDLISKIMLEHGFKDKELELISEQVALGAVKYSILKVGRLVDMAFDLENSISLSGNSGPYIQYTYARCRSVIEKSLQLAGISLQTATYHLPSATINSEELCILRYLYRFPEVVEQAGSEFAPHVICTYLYELAQKFNAFYNQYSILQAGNTDLLKFRLNMTQSVAIVLKNGLKLLGINAPDKM